MNLFIQIALSRIAAKTVSFLIFDKDFEGICHKNQTQNFKRFTIFYCPLWKNVFATTIFMLYISILKKKRINK